MLYVIHCANHPELDYRGGQEPIVHLRPPSTPCIRGPRNEGCRRRRGEGEGARVLLPRSRSVERRERMSLPRWGRIDTNSGGILERLHASVTATARADIRLLVQILCNSRCPAWVRGPPAEAARTSRCRGGVHVPERAQQGTTSSAQLKTYAERIWRTRREVGNVFRASSLTVAVGYSAGFTDGTCVPSTRRLLQLRHRIRALSAAECPLGLRRSEDCTRKFPY
jgi:hypothetical protein